MRESPISCKNRDPRVSNLGTRDPQIGGPYFCYLWGQSHSNVLSNYIKHQKKSFYFRITPQDNWRSGSYTLAGPPHSVQMESSLYDTLSSLVAQVQSTFPLWHLSKFFVQRSMLVNTMKLTISASFIKYRCPNYRFCTKGTHNINNYYGNSQLWHMSLTVSA